MPKKTIYIHIGTPKTGTTAIQHFLRMNNNILLRNGFMVYTAQDDKHIDRNLRFLTTYLNVFGKIELINKGLLPKNKSKHKKILEDWYTNFLNDIKHSSSDKIILSEEMLWWAVCGKEKMLKLFGDLNNHFKLKFIVYLRRQDYYLMSIYQQSLKAGGCQGLKCADWLADNENLQTSLYSHYAENLKWLSELVEKKNIIIRIYEKEQFDNQSIFNDFLTTINLELTDEFKIPQKNINKGLSPFAIELARCFSKHNHDNSIFMHFISRYKNNELFNEFENQHNLLSPSERCNLLSQYEAGNNFIAKELLHRENGQLFHEPNPMADTNWTPYELPMDDAISFLLKVADKQDRKIQYLENIIAKQEHCPTGLRLIYTKLPKPVQYPIRKVCQLGKSLKIKIFRETE